MLHGAVAEGNGYSAKVGSTILIYRKQATMNDTQLGNCDGKALGNYNIVIRLGTPVLLEICPEAPAYLIFNHFLSSIVSVDGCGDCLPTAGQPIGDIRHIQFPAIVRSCPPPLYEARPDKALCYDCAVFGAYLYSRFAPLFAEDLCRGWRRGRRPSQIATNAPKRRSGPALFLLLESGPSSPDTALTGATNGSDP